MSLRRCWCLGYQEQRPNFVEVRPVEAPASTSGRDFDQSKTSNLLRSHWHCNDGGHALLLLLHPSPPHPSPHGSHSRSLACLDAPRQTQLLSPNLRDAPSGK